MNTTKLYDSCFARQLETDLARLTAELAECRGRGMTLPPTATCFSNKAAKKTDSLSSKVRC